jgi:hypothetical protein
MKQKAGSLKKINKIDKSLANVTKMNREKTQISKIRNKKEELTTNSKEIIRDYFENLHSIKLENLEEMNKFQGTYDHPKLNQEDINHLNISITGNEIEAAIDSQKEKSRPDGFSVNSTRF